MKEIKNEVTRKNLVGKTKVQSPERYDKRLRYSTMSIPEIDEDKLLNFDRLVITVRVGNYTDNLAFDGVMQKLIEIVKKDPKHVINRRAVIRAMNEQVDAVKDVYVRCTCIAPYTQIKLLSGEIADVESLLQRYNNGEDLWVYSVDNKGDFKPGKVTLVQQTGETLELVRVTLDTGECIDTTSDHLYLCRDGSWKQACELSEGQSLMPLYFMKNDKATNGYERVKRNSEHLHYDSVYKVVAEEVLKDDIEAAKRSSGEDSIAIHHIDYNKDNNCPYNLKPMGRQEHYLWHAKTVSDRWKNDPVFREKASSSSRAVAEKINANPTDRMIETRRRNLSKGHWRNQHLSEEERNAQANICRQAITTYWKNMTPEEYAAKCREISERNNDPDNKAKISNACKKYWENLSPEAREARSKKFRGSANPACRLEVRQERCFHTLDYLVASGMDLTESNYNEHRRHSDPKPETVFKDFDDMLNCYNKRRYNHKVVKVEVIKLDTPMPVYDISVDKYHNFYVNAGVILHNCPDFRYRYAYFATKYDYLWGPPENRPSNMTNPKDNIGATCKHLACILSNKKWLVKASSVVNDFIHENYHEILQKYNLSEDDFRYDEQAYYAASVAAAKQAMRRLPPDLLGATNRLYDAENLEQQLFELLDDRGWWISVDNDLDTPNYVRVSKDAKAIDTGEPADAIYTFEVVPAGTRVKLKRVENITENY